MSACLHPVPDAQSLLHSLFQNGERIPGFPGGGNGPRGGFGAVCSVDLGRARPRRRACDSRRLSTEEGSGHEKREKKSHDREARAGTTSV